eukprot:TRINITY_DN9690_c0_g1_i1.p1 TRINITY_DN9690_c0_g1~~TRINITY_DN9690_c0_g1_i1.p1  ORF type:complete len:252 (+),score=78.58 TRINITY_DN9690_c0_g1_i1:79-834(+)
MSITTNYENSALSKELKKKVVALRDEIAVKAQQVLHEEMPQKILDLDNLFKNCSELNGDPAEAALSVALSRASSEGERIQSNNKKRKLNDSKAVSEGADDAVAYLPVNKTIKFLLEKLKSELLEMIMMVDTVKVWIQMTIPRIEDGNNFGVQIQEETVGELGRVESDAFTVLENMTKYYLSRAKLLSKVRKHPEMEDYRQSVIELDEKQFLNLRLVILDLRNNFSILFDMIIKNLTKISNPRPSNHSSSMF